LAAQGLKRPRGTSKHIHNIKGRQEEIDRCSELNNDLINFVEVGVTTQASNRFDTHGKGNIRGSGGKWSRGVGIRDQFWGVVAIVATTLDLTVFRSMFEVVSISDRWSRTSLHPYFTSQEVQTLFHQLETMFHENVPSLNNLATGGNDILMYGSLVERDALKALREDVFNSTPGSTPAQIKITLPSILTNGECTSALFALFFKCPCMSFDV